MIVLYRFKSYTSLLLSMKATVRLRSLRNRECDSSFFFCLFIDLKMVSQDKRLSCSTVCKRHYSHDKKELDESLQREVRTQPHWIVTCWFDRSSHCNNLLHNGLGSLCEPTKTRYYFLRASLYAFGFWFHLFCIECSWHYSFCLQRSQLSSWNSGEEFI